MKIIVVCKHNQARSIMMAALMRRFYPDYAVLSAGVKADTGGSIPAAIREIADIWGLEITEDFSQNYADICACATIEDLVLAADSEVAEQIRSITPSFKPTDISESAPNSQWSPADPLNMSPAQTRAELAKALLLSHHCAAIRIGIPSKIYGSVLAAKRVINQALAWQSEYRGNVLDVSMRVLDPEPWERSGAFLQSFNPRQLSRSGGVGGPQVLVPAFESDLRSRILLSQAWADWVFALAAERPLLIVSSSLSEGNQATEERALGLIHASEFLA